MSSSAHHAAALAASALRIVLLLAMPALCWPAAAQQPAEPDAARLTAAKALAELTPLAGMATMMTRMVDTAEEAFGLDRLSASKANLIEQFHNETNAAVAEHHARTYSQDELEVLLAFHTTPLARRFSEGGKREPYAFLPPPDTARIRAAHALAEEVHAPYAASETVESLRRPVALFGAAIFGADPEEVKKLTQQIDQLFAPGGQFDPNGALMKEHFDEALEEAADRYAQAFALDDLNTLLAFNTSPLGRKYRDEVPRMIALLTLPATRMLQNAMLELGEMMKLERMIMEQIKPSPKGR